MASTFLPGASSAWTTSACSTVPSLYRTAAIWSKRTARPGWHSICATMLSMALELAAEDPAYEDVASKFFEHFVAIADAMNTLGGMGLWDDRDGFYYDRLPRTAR